MHAHDKRFLLGLFIWLIIIYHFKGIPGLFGFAQDMWAILGIFVMALVLVINLNKEELILHAILGTLKLIISFIRGQFYRR
jgi:hypothetical protein